MQEVIFFVDFIYVLLLADLSEPRVRRQPGSDLRRLAPDGSLGVLHGRRLPPKPQTLPHLQRQGLPAGQPPAQITPWLGRTTGLYPKITHRTHRRVVNLLFHSAQSSRNVNDGNFGVTSRFNLAG